MDLIFPSDSAESKRLSHRARQGKITQVRRGLYIDSTNREVVAQAVTANWMKIVRSFCPEGTIAAYRTAQELVPVEGEVFVVSPVKHNRRVPIGDYLVINIFPGDVQGGIEPMAIDMHRSAPARLCLENLTRSSGRRRTVDKARGREWVEEYLSRYLARQGEDGLNALRDEARILADTLWLPGEYTSLNEIVQALLNTHAQGDTVLQSELAIATARKEPFDPSRLDHFRQLADYLASCELDTAGIEYTTNEWRNASFFEAYFSNFIEGTEFTIEEAEQIIFEHKLNAERPKDSHDVLGTYEIASDRQEMLSTPETADDLLRLIQHRHERMMHARPEVHPGEFKQLPNKAGSTYFVSPEELIGTLSQSMPIYTEIEPGISRAIFIHFVISECHPMDDGNGRLSRLFLNAELHTSGLAKLIIPNVHRESYVNGLRLASRTDMFRTMVKVLHQMHLYSASLPWADYGELLHTLQEHQADRDPDEGVGAFNRVISEWHREYPVG